MGTLISCLRHRRPSLSLLKIVYTSYYRERFLCAVDVFIIIIIKSHNMLYTGILLYLYTMYACIQSDPLTLIINIFNISSKLLLFFFL